MYAEIYARCSLSDKFTQERSDVFLQTGSMYMVNKFWLRCGLLVCGVLLISMGTGYAEPAAPAKSSGQSLAISGKVSIAPSLAGKGSATDTLFVFARETNGPPMPVAIMRATKKDLPFTFRLDDSNQHDAVQKTLRRRTGGDCGSSVEVRPGYAAKWRLRGDESTSEAWSRRGHRRHRSRKTVVSRTKRALSHYYNA